MLNKCVIDITKGARVLLVSEDCPAPNREGLLPPVEDHLNAADEGDKACRSDAAAENCEKQAHEVPVKHERQADRDKNKDDCGQKDRHEPWHRGNDQLVGGVAGDFHGVILGASGHSSKAALLFALPRIGFMCLMGGRSKGASKIATSANPPETPSGVPTRRSESGKGVLLMLLGMFLFAAVDTGAKFLTAELHPIQITWTRQLGLLAGAFFLIAYHGRTILRTSHPKLQVLRGCVAVGSATLFIVGVSYVPLADAVAVTFVAPFIVTLLAAFILGEPVGIRRWIAVFLGFVGTLIVIRPGMSVIHPAAFLIVIAAAFFAVRQIISRALSDTDKTATTIVYTAIVGSALLTLPLPFVWITPDSQQVMILVGIAALAGVAEVCVIKAFEVAMAVVIAPIHYSMMIWGTFYGFVVFGQLPDMWTVIGAAVIISTGLYTLRREYLISHGRV